ncbi:MAG: FkbM family methyltransferase [Kaiparowitsia implicata GSE-PSE-MK54-09C]|nr:FkbM family methyltransferase [Kaiparowitsia implicata GSE-PSE-MK54-09C]
MKAASFGFERLLNLAGKLGWGLRVAGPLAAFRGLGRLAKLWLTQPAHADARLRCGPILEFDYPGQFPAALVAFGDFIDPEFDFLRNVAKSGWTIVDVGAAIGQFTIFAAVCLPGATVHAFEPSSANVATLRRNLARNRVEKRVVVHQAALSNRKDTARFATASKTWMSQLAADDSPNLCVELVEVDTLAVAVNSLQLDHVNVLKINVAGFEPAVIEGAMPCLKAGQVDILIVLLGLTSLAWYRAISELGYGFFYYHPRKRTLFEVTTFDEAAVLEHRPWPARHIIVIRKGALQDVVGDKIRVQPLL